MIYWGGAPKVYLKKQAVKKFIKPNTTNVLFMLILFDSKNLIAQGCATPASSPEIQHIIPAVARICVGNDQKLSTKMMLSYTERTNRNKKQNIDFRATLYLTNGSAIQSDSKLINRQRKNCVFLLQSNLSAKKTKRQESMFEIPDMILSKNRSVFWVSCINEGAQKRQLDTKFAMTRGIMILRSEANLQRSITLNDSSFDQELYYSLKLYIYSYCRSGFLTPFFIAILFRAPIISSVFSVANRSIGVFYTQDTIPTITAMTGTIQKKKKTVLQSLTLQQVRLLSIMPIPFAKKMRVMNKGLHFYETTSVPQHGVNCRAFQVPIKVMNTPTPTI